MTTRKFSVALILMFLLSPSGLFASPTQRLPIKPGTVSPNTAPYKRLNAFFSEVAQADLASFNVRPSDSEMIGFALVHILMKQPGLLQRESGISGFARVQPKQVEQVAEAFFGQRIRQNKTISAQFRYGGGSYLVSTGEWEEMLFAQVTGLRASERGRFTADVAIYSTTASFGGDVNASPATWNNTPFQPRLEKRMRATVQQVHRGHSLHYVLLAYEKLLPS